MDQLAHLIIRVDGQGVEKAADSLEKVAKSADKVEVSSDKMAKASEHWAKKQQDASYRQYQANERLENQFKRNSQSFIAMSQARATAVDNAFKRNEQTFIMGEQRRAAAAIEAERKIQEARQQTIDKARLENRFSGAAGGWGGGGGGGGTINGVPAGGFGRPGGLLPGVTVSNIAGKVGPLAAGLGVGFGLNEIKNTIVEMEVLEARLLTVAGSSQKANEMFSQLKILDRQLPHDLKELTGAFVNLVHLGLTPSEEALRSYSAISSASTKSIEDVVLAVSRGVAGDFRRIRSLGVEAEVMGDKVKLTFNNISEVVDRSKAGLEGYFIKLGQSSTFAEASANKMKTLAGSISNLDSAWKNFISTGSKGGVSDVLSTLLKGLTYALDGWNYLVTTLMRQVERAAEIAAHISNFEFKEAAKKTGKVAAASLTVGISDAWLEDTGSPTSLGSAKAPPAVKTEDEILDEIEATHKSNMEKIELEIQKRKELRDFKLQFESEEARLEAEGADKIQAIWQNQGLSAIEKEQFHAKVLEEHAAKIAKIRENAENKVRADADKTAKVLADAEEKRKADKAALDRFIMGDDKEGEITAAKIKRDEWIGTVTEAGSAREQKALEVSNNLAIAEFTKLAESRREILKREYEDRERQIQRAFRNSNGKELERNKQSEENWQNYVDSVAKISVGGGIIAAPDPGDAPFKVELTKPEQDDLKFKELESKYERELRMLNDAREAQNMTDAAYMEESRKLWRQYTSDLENISTTGAMIVYMKNLEMSSTVLGMSANIAGQLDQLAQGQSDAAKATFMAVKSISIAQAIVNTELAATRAIAEGGFFAGVPMSAMIRGLGYASVAIMAATSVQEYAGKFADGGIVPGSSMSGDNLVARVNSGEMILNSGQQRNLFDMASGRMGGSGGITVNVYNEAGVEVETQTREDGKTIDLIIRRVKGEIASDLDTGKSQIGSVLEKRYAVRRRGA